MLHRALVVAAAVAVALPGCAASGLSFVQDDRVDVVRPKDRSKVALPVRVAWTVKDFAVGPGRGAFGVLIDRSPPPSGRTLGWLFRGDPTCKGAAARTCESPAFLAQRDIHVTTKPTVTYAQVPRLSGSQAGRQLHEVTVVLLDAAGRRVGEGAWSVQFEVKAAT